jgi:hypothetical protein
MRRIFSASLAALLIVGMTASAAFAGEVNRQWPQVS